MRVEVSYIPYATLSTDYDCSDGPISTNTLEEISNVSQII